MKKIFLSLIMLLGITANINAQSVSLIICEKYGTYGPEGVGTVFTPGYLTVVAYGSSEMYYDEISIQYDKKGTDGQYYFYKKFTFDFPDGYKTVYFSKTGNNNMEFNHTGYYRVFLLDKYGNTIAHTTVSIVN
jgi:hypothetical protein